MSTKQYKIQIVEDDEAVVEVLTELITIIGHTIVGSSPSAKDALYYTGEIQPDLVLMDIGLSGEMDGIEAAKELKSLHNLPVVFVTGNVDNETIERAKQAEPMGYLIKPVGVQELKVTIEFAIFKHRLQLEKENLITELTDAVSNVLRNYAQSENMSFSPHDWFH